jgi:hypothetical protein
MSSQVSIDNHAIILAGSFEGIVVKYEETVNNVCTHIIYDLPNNIFRSLKKIIHVILSRDIG